MQRRVSWKKTLYRDRDKGMIRVNPDRTVPETEVRAYAGNLERKDGNIQDLNDIHAKKAQKDVELRDEQIKKLRFFRKKEEGKYLLKKDFEAELAALAMVFESGFLHLFTLKVREFIGLVGGNIAQSADLLEALNTALDEQLNSYATTKTFQVMFEEDD